MSSISKSEPGPQALDSLSDQRLRDALALRRFMRRQATPLFVEGAAASIPLEDLARCNLAHVFKVDEGILMLPAGYGLELDINVANVVTRHIAIFDERRGCQCYSRFKTDLHRSCTNWRQCDLAAREFCAKVRL
jgi:hypothetical protein